MPARGIVSNWSWYRKLTFSGHYSKTTLQSRSWCQWRQSRAELVSFQFPWFVRLQIQNSFFQINLFKLGNVRSGCLRRIPFKVRAILAKIIYQKSTHSTVTSWMPFYPLSVRGVPHWRVKSSGVRQSKIYKCHECAYGHWGVKTSNCNSVL